MNAFPNMIMRIANTNNNRTNINSRTGNENENFFDSIFNRNMNHNTFNLFCLDLQ